MAATRALPSRSLSSCASITAYASRSSKSSTGSSVSRPSARATRAAIAYVSSTRARRASSNAARSAGTAFCAARACASRYDHWSAADAGSYAASIQSASAARSSGLLFPAPAARVAANISRTLTAAFSGDVPSTSHARFPSFTCAAAKSSTTCPTSGPASRRSSSSRTRVPDSVSTQIASGRNPCSTGSSRSSIEGLNSSAISRRWNVPSTSTLVRTCGGWTAASAAIGSAGTAPGDPSTGPAKGTRARIETSAATREAAPNGVRWFMSVPSTCKDEIRRRKVLPTGHTRRVRFDDR